MAGQSCDIYPLINGEPSILYRDLLDLVGNNRPLANLIYAYYLQQGVDAQMDSNPKYARNRQGQHRAVDLYNFFNVGQVIIDQADGRRKAMEIAGSVDSDGNRISYTDGKQALDKASAFNKGPLGDSFVASVQQHEDKFQIYVEAKDSRTQIEQGRVEEQLKNWDIITQVFTQAGLDINTFAQLNPNAFNPILSYRMTDILESYSMSRPQDFDIFSELDLKIVLSLNKNNPIVQRLIQRFGDIDTLAAEMYDYTHNNHPFSATDIQRFESAKAILNRIGGIDVAALKAQLNNNSSVMHGSEQHFMVAETLKNLGRKINPNLIDNFNKLENRIRSLSEAAIKSATILKRKLKEAQNQKDDAKVLEIQKKLDKILNQIEGKYYYSGVLELMQSLTTDVNTLYQNITNIPTGLTRFEQIQYMAKNYASLKEILENYRDVIKSLSNLDKMIINENISEADEQNLQNIARQLDGQLNNVEEILNGSRASLMRDILKEYLGNNVINGLAIEVMATHASQDASFFDRFLYGSTDMSNPVIGTIGAIIRKAQQDRDSELTEINDRIRQASYRLEKAGIKDTEWMYDADGRIISDIDWEAYEQAKKAYIDGLKSRGIKGYELSKEIFNWEENNTEDRVVDKKSNRTEKVPNSRYRKALVFASSAHEEYYTTMMQLKGELGTMLPSYARDHYTPPQIRMGLWDALRDARKNYKGLDKYIRQWNVLWSKFADLFTFREDDTFVHKNDYFDRETSIAEVNPDGTIRRRIPIFYRNNLKDPSMLDKNFGHVINLMATTAVNFKVMNKIEDVVLYMRDYVPNMGVYESDDLGRNPIDITRGLRTSIIERVYKSAAESNVYATINGIIDTQMYSVTKYSRTRWNKFILSLLNYTSWSSLTVNAPGAIINTVQGHIQTIIEASGGEFYTWSDWLKAEASTFNPSGVGRRCADLANGTKTSLTTLLNDRFNVTQSLYEDIKSDKFYLDTYRRIVHSGNSMVLYGIGEYNIHQVNMRAVLIHEKVLYNGKKVSLLDVFDQTSPVDGVSKLIIKPGATRLDGSPITEEYLDSLMNIIKLVNQEHHGSMSQEDKGLIHSYLWGKLIMNFRQWMVKHYSRRYRKKHIDTLTGKEREGFYITLANFGLALALEVKCLRDLSIKLIGNESKIDKFSENYKWKTATKATKANIRKAMTELIIYGLLFALMKFVLDDDDDDKNKKERSWIEWLIYKQVDRLLVEVGGSVPFGIPGQSTTLINKPIPAVNTYNKLIYPIIGIPEIFETYKAGIYEGENKYWHKFLYNTLPFVKQIDYLINPEHDKTRLWDR